MLTRKFVFPYKPVAQRLICVIIVNFNVSLRIFGLMEWKYCPLA